MKKITEIQSKKPAEKPAEKTTNLWNSFDAEPFNTCDYIADRLGLLKVSAGFVENAIVIFREGIKPSSVLDPSTTIEDVIGLPASEFGEYGIIDIFTLSVNIGELSKPNGFGIYLNIDNDHNKTYRLIMTNGSTFKNINLHTTQG